MTGSETVRLDKWLWFARFCKSRALAQTLIERGQVTVDGHPVAKTAFPLRPGQEVAMTFGQQRRTVRVLAAGVRRGPPTEARALYEETAPPERLAPGDGAPPLNRPRRFSAAS